MRQISDSQAGIGRDKGWEQAVHTTNTGPCDTTKQTVYMLWLF